MARIAVKSRSRQDLKQKLDIVVLMCLVQGLQSDL